jgi:hypothetical protein
MTKKLKRRAIDDAIYRAVRGDPSSPWRVDPKHKGGNDFEVMFRARDKQALLWAIDDCAQKGEPIPAWATKALHKILYDAAKGKFSTWDDAFGGIFRDRKWRRGIRTDSRMYEVYDKIVEYSEAGYKIDADLYQRVGDELGIGKRETVKNLWKRVKADAIKQGRHVSKPLRERVLNSKANLKG